MPRTPVFALCCCLAACGSTPTTPTPPPVVVVPPPVVTPPPPPAITSYAGHWLGEYVVVQCAGSSGSMGDILCSAPHGVNTGGLFQPGTRLTLGIDLSQSGASVNGVLALGPIRGPVSGSVVNQRLVLSGTLLYSDALSGLAVTARVTGWDTALVGDILSGDFSLNITMNAFPGDGVVLLRLQNTTRR